jgi:hypothetical protein
MAGRTGYRAPEKVSELRGGPILITATIGLKRHRLRVGGSHGKNSAAHLSRALFVRERGGRETDSLRRGQVWVSKKNAAVIFFEKDDVVVDAVRVPKGTPTASGRFGLRYAQHTGRQVGRGGGLGNIERSPLAL